jgi:hypothetical protein
MPTGERDQPHACRGGVGLFHSEQRGHSGTPAIRQAWPNFSTSSSRRNGVLLIPEMRKAASVCRTASQARRASAMRPAIARFAINIRRALGKFGWRWMALVAMGQTFFMPPGKEMSVGHPGLVQERVGIDRTQANGCRELLDRRVVIAEINLCPACPKARHTRLGSSAMALAAKADPVSDSSST